MLGLYYFTTQTNQILQGNSAVDIGYHYVAIDQSGIPLATFNDGIADYLDDPNGNGLPNWWELEYFGSLEQNATNDFVGDGLSDLFKYENDLNPTNYDNSQLAIWTFQDTNSWDGDQGQIPLNNINLIGVPAPVGNALVMQSTNVSIVSYKLYEANGNENIDITNGTLSLYYMPSWSSVTAGGSGPGVNGRLIESGSYSSSLTNDWWALYTTPSGNQLVFETIANNECITNITANISLMSNLWYEITLTYCSTNSSLYLNFQQLTNGLGAPVAFHLGNAFEIGSDSCGNNQAGGQISSIQTFNYPLSSSQVSSTSSRIIPEVTGPNCGQIQYSPPSPYFYPTMAVGFGTALIEPIVTNETVSLTAFVGIVSGEYTVKAYNQCGFLEEAEYQWGVSSLYFNWTTFSLNNETEIAIGSTESISYSPAQAEDELIYVSVLGLTAAPLTYPISATDDPVVLPVAVFPRMRLGFWRFNDPSLAGDRGQVPLIVSNCDVVPCPFGNGVNFDSSSIIKLEYAYYQNDAVSTNFEGTAVNFGGTPNFRWDRGTVRFWFSPDWSSGNGPTNGGDFLCLTNPGYVSNWTLMLTNAGSTIELDAAGGGGFTSHFTQAINLASNQWYQIAVTYSPNEITVYTNGNQVGTVGSGVVQAGGYNAGYFNVGSDGGKKQIRGSMENLETYNYELSASQILADYQSDAAIDTDGAGISNIQQFEIGIDPSDPPGGNDSPITSPSGGGETSPPVIQLLDPANAIQQ